MKLKAALDLFLKLDRSPQTRRSYTGILTTMVNALGPERKIVRVTFADLIDYVDHLRERLKPSSLFTQVNVIKAFFNWAVRQRLLEHSPTDGITIRTPHDDMKSRAIPSDALATMIDAVRYDKRALALILLLTDTGCRVGSVASLTLDRLNLDDRTVLLLEKGSAWHTGYFSPPTADALRAWLAVRPQTTHQFVFTTKGNAGNPLQPNGLGAIIRRTARLAGLPKDYGPHSIRHAVGNALAHAGVPVTITQQKLGHRSSGTTLRYYYPKGEALVREVSERLPLAPLQQKSDAKIIGIQPYLRQER